MTINNVTCEVVRIGDGVTIDFSFPFTAGLASDIVVYNLLSTGEQVVLDPSTYTVFLGPNSGVVRLEGVNIVPVGQKIVIGRNTPVTQLVSVSSQAAYDPKVHEGVWDKLTRKLQEINRRLQRTPIVGPEESVDTFISDIYAARDSAAASAIIAASYGSSTFASRAAAQAATILIGTLRILVLHQGKGLWYVRDAAGTALTTTGAVNWSPDPAYDIWIEHWGTDAGDCTAKIQAGLDYVATLGGGELHGGKNNYTIDGNLTVPVNVKLSGPHVDGCGSPGNNFSAPYQNTTGALLLNSAASITILSNGGINGWLVQRKGMSFPTANASAFAGTAVVIAGDDVTVRRNMIMGFNRAIDLNGFNRPRIESNNLDNVNGIRLQNCFDTPYLVNNHSWPFATIEAVANGASPGINLTRTGIAYELISGDWAICEGNFSYGYFRGHFSSANSVRIIGGGADNPVSAGVPLNVGSIGFQVNGARNTLTGINAAGNVRGISLGTVASAETQINGGHVWGNSTHGIIIDGAGLVSISGMTVKDADYAITVNNVAAEVVDGGGNVFQNSTFSDWNFAVASNTDVVRIDKIATTKGAGGSPVSANLLLKSLTAAATLALPMNSNTFLVNGNTNIDDITGYWPGRVVTLIFTGTPTVGHATSAASKIALSNGLGFVAANRKTLVIVWNGAQWVEVGRSGGNNDDKFPTRAAFVTWATANVVSAGAVRFAAGFAYRYTGASVIPDLPGWEPIFTLSPQHFGSTNGASVTAAWTYFNSISGTTAQLARPASTALPLYFPAGRYNSGGSNLVLTAGGTGQVIYGDGRVSQLCNITLNMGDNNLEVKNLDWWEGAKAVDAIIFSPRGAAMRWGSITNVRIRDYRTAITLSGDNAWMTLSGVEIERCVDGLLVNDTVGTGMADCSIRLNDNYGAWIKSGGELRMMGTDIGNNGNIGLFGQYVSNVLVENYWESCSISNNQTNLANRDTFAISAAASNGAGGTTLTIGAHSMTEGMQGIIIQGTTSYNGTFDVFNVTNTTVDIAVAFVSTQTGTVVRREWDVKFVNASGVISNVNDQMFTDCNINMMSLQNCYNFSFIGCRLKEQLWLAGGCERISRIGAGRGRQINSHKDIDISGQNYGFSELIQSNPGSASFTSKGGMVMRAPDFVGGALVGNKPSKYNSVEVTSDGGVKIGGRFGYGYGGGAVTQLISRATGVTINAPCGAITLFSAAGSATATSFTVTNSAVVVTDTIIPVVKSSANKYLVFITAVGAGSFEVTFFTTGGTAVDAPVINFTVMRAVTA